VSELRDIAEALRVMSQCWRYMPTGDFERTMLDARKEILSLRARLAGGEGSPPVPAPADPPPSAAAFVALTRRVEALEAAAGISGGWNGG